jgi:hypothetical protein
LGHLDAGPDLAHGAYLVALTMLGFALARRSFRRRLVT